MKLQQVIPIVAMASVASFTAFGVDTPANAAESRFNCSNVDGVPTTIANTSRGAVSVIRWTSNYFGSSGYSPQSRCHTVSQKFEAYHQNGTLNFLTTGTVNRLPVICVAESQGGSCTGVLFTLKPGSNPSRTLRQLINVRDRASGPLNETSARVYIDIDKFLKAAPVEKADSIEAVKIKTVDTDSPVKTAKEEEHTISKPDANQSDPVPTKSLW